MRPLTAVRHSPRVRGQAMCLCLALVAVLAGCGGGERERLAAAFGGTRCADFAYQEDAQAAYERGFTALDGDNDRIACEGRPRRNPQNPQPGTAPPDPAPPAALTTVATLLTAEGATYVIKRSSDQQLTVNWEARVDGTGRAGSESARFQQLDATTAEAAGATVTVRVALAAQNTLVGWTRRNDTNATATGFGVAGSAAATLADVAGTYRALGQQCAPDGTACAPLAATLTIGSDAWLTVCPGAEHTATCANQERRALSPSPLDVGVWRIGGAGENLVAHRATGAVALTYATAAGTVSLHGHRDTFTATTGSIAASITFDSNGEPSVAVPPFTNAPFTADQPLPGFFANAAGDIFLASTAGQAVAWVSGVGLRHYSAP